MEENKATLPENVHLSIDFNSLSQEEQQLVLSWIERINKEK